MTRRQRTDFLWMLLIMALCCVATCALTPAPPPPVAEVDASLWFRTEPPPAPRPPLRSMQGRRPPTGRPYNFTGSRVRKLVEYRGVIGPRTYPHHRKPPAQ